MSRSRKKGKGGKKKGRAGGRAEVKAEDKAEEKALNSEGAEDIEKESEKKSEQKPEKEPEKKPVKRDGGSGGVLELSTAVVSVAGLDELELDVLALGVFGEDRPLRGTAGLCDWRLNGRLSSMIQSGGFTCEEYNTLMADTNGRVATPLILLFGLGKRESLDQASCRQSLRHMLVVAKKAKFNAIGLEIPGLLDESLDAETAIKALIEVALKAHPSCRLTVLCHHKDLADKVRAQADDDSRIKLS